MTLTQTRKDKLFEKAKRFGQGHIFRWWDDLSEPERDGLLVQVESVDFQLLDRLINSLIRDDPSKHTQEKLEPAEIIRVPRTDEEKRAEQRARERGEQLLREGTICVLLVAGGQATRMGYPRPKGTFPIGPVSGKSLFELHAEKIRASARRYGTVIPWYIMTSDMNDEETRRFFQDHDYFGVSSDDVMFLMQDMLPTVDVSGKIIMDSKSRLFMSPTGHGASLRTMYDRGALADMKSRGVEYIFHFQVDNPLVRLCDPVFIGYHDLNGSEMSSKMVWKNSPTERVGTACVKDGTNVIIEYSDLDPNVANERTPDGRLRFWAGNIAQHVLSASFVERMRPSVDRMPLHRARKKVPYINDRGDRIVPENENGVKFESFVFDAIPYATKIVHMEIVREKEYTPVKTLRGNESVEAARQRMSTLYGTWLERAGINVPRDGSGKVSALIEISPLFALDEEECVRKVNRDIVVREKLYLSES